MARIVVSDPLAAEGFELMIERGHEPVDITALQGADREEAVASAEGWVLRSGTQLTADLMAKAPQLRGVGRAGVGVDNVDLTAATERGIAVFNSPTGNITSAAEQAWALMLAVARRVPEADAAMKQEDWARKRLKGTELAGKTLFIVGLGKIGRMMAARAQAFEMTCLGYDPFVTPEAAKAFGVEWVEVDAGFARADIITLHTPLVPATANLVNADRLSLCKSGAILVNAARGGLVDGDAVLEALESGRLAGAGFDVWPEEPPSDWRLAKHPRMVAAPHLGASTHEAQTKAAVQACERLCDFLDSADAGLAVNAVASVPDKLRPWATLAERMGAFAAQTLDGPLQQITVSADPDLPLDAMKLHALVGILRASTDGPVNGINAAPLVQERGWTVATRTLPQDDPDFVRIELATAQSTCVIEGTYTPHYGPRVTMFNGFDLEFRPTGRFLLTRHQDVPGVLAAITSALAESGVNVAAMSLARHKTDLAAVAAIRIDGSIPQEARDKLRSLASVESAHRIRLDG